MFDLQRRTDLTLAILGIGIVKGRLQMLEGSARHQTVAVLAPDAEDLTTLLTLVASTVADVQHSKVMERCVTLVTGIVKDLSRLRYPPDRPLAASSVPIVQSAMMDPVEETRRHGAREGR